MSAVHNENTVFSEFCEVLQKRENNGLVMMPMKECLNDPALNGEEQQSSSFIHTMAKQPFLVMTCPILKQNWTRDVVFEAMEKRTVIFQHGI